MVWLLVYFSIIPMQLSNYVLCIGTDGHVEFEIAVDGRCTRHAYALHEMTHRGCERLCTFRMERITVARALISLSWFPVDTQPYLVPAQECVSTSRPTSASYAHITSPLKWLYMLLTHTPLLDIPSIVSPALVSLRTTALLI